MTSIQHQKLAKSGSLHRGIKVSPNYSGPQKFTINITYPSQPKWNLFDRNSLPSVHLVMLLPIEIQNLTVIGDRVNLLWGGPNIANDIAVESGQLSTSGIRFTSPLSSRNIAIKAGMGRIELNHVQASGVVLLENDSDSGIVAFIKGYTNFSAISKTGGMRLDLAPGVEASWTEVVTEGKLGSAINLAIRGFQGRYYLKGGLSMNGSVFPPESLSPAVGYIGSKEGKGNLKAITNTWMPLRVDFDPPSILSLVDRRQVMTKTETPNNTHHLTDSAKGHENLPSYVSTSLEITTSASGLHLLVSHPGASFASYTIVLDKSNISSQAKNASNLSLLANVDQFCMRTLQEEVPVVTISDYIDQTLLLTMTPFSTSPGPLQKLEFKASSNCGDCVFALTPNVGFKSKNSQNLVCSFQLPTTNAKYQWEASIEREKWRSGKKIVLTLHLLESAKQASDSNGKSGRVGSFFQKFVSSSSSNVNRIAVATYETVTPNGHEKSLLKGVLQPISDVPWRNADECAMFLGSVIAAMYGIAYEIDVIYTMNMNQRLYL
ncbi:hypothetical protein BDR26DRAFT_853743 [Obelidium mucronatum]|nr:hypothetical protein BDR26DRAFT_853743 [Obelidium mucronatum]